MKEFLKKPPTWLIYVIIAAFLAGVTLTWLGLSQKITIFLNDDVKVIRTSALTIHGVLKASGVMVEPEDRIQPDKAGLIWNQAAIQVDRARTLLIQTSEDEISLRTAEKIPANLMQTLGIELFPQDQLLINGVVIDPDQPIEFDDTILIQYQPAIPLVVSIDDTIISLFTNQPTLGAALESESIFVGKNDWISMDPLTPITGNIQVEIRRARPVTVKIADQTFTGMTAALTVGDALLQLGIPLQNLDYSVPSESDVLPPNAEIKIVRVEETLAIMTDETPYESDYQEDPETALDQYTVIQEGQNGIIATRERIKLEEGEEVWRSPTETWQASVAENGIMGYGTQVVVQTEIVDGQTIEYWRKISVYATSYKPCDANGVCYYGTAGGNPVQQGIIAVSPHWYSVPNGLGMADLPVYVPGYGYAIIDDVCGGCSGQFWIDLAYTEDDYVPWYFWTTMYFLTPVPQRYIPAIITP